MALKMTFDEFMNKMLEAFPGSLVEPDAEGHLTITTNLKMVGMDVVERNAKHAGEEEEDPC